MLSKSVILSASFLRRTSRNASDLNALARLFGYQGKSLVRAGQERLRLKHRGRSFGQKTASAWQPC